MSILSSVVGMTLKIEKLGTTIPFLEATLCFDGEGSPDLRVHQPTFSFQHGISTPPSPVRLLDTHSPSASACISLVLVLVSGR